MDQLVGEARPLRRDEQVLFRTVLAALDSSPELAEFLQRALASMLHYLGRGSAGLVLVEDPQHPGLVVAAHEGMPAPLIPVRVFWGDCLCREIADGGIPILSRDCRGCACNVNSWPEPRVHLAVPLKTRETVLGAFCLVGAPGLTIDDQELSVWEDIGILVGRAVDHSQTRSQVDQERELLQILFEVSEHLATSLDLDWVLSRVLDLSIAATGAQDGSVFLLPVPGTRGARILRRALPPAEADLVIEEVLGRGLAGWVVRHKEVAIVADTSTDPQWLPFPDELDPPGSALAAPLIAGGSVLGVMTLTHREKEHYHDRDIAIVLAIAGQAAVAIEKARLHEDVSRLADKLAQRVEEQTQELKEIHAQLIQAEKLAALGELAAGIAHEINNPLHILQAYVEYMQTRLALDREILDVLGPMDHALENIARLANQLRDFSRPAAGEWKEVPINDAIDRVLRLVRKELMHNHVEVTALLAPALPAVMGDVRQMEQVFLNLILNARDAMPGGGQLTVETRADSKIVYIRIADTGVGISSEHLPHIFEPYFTTKEDRGTGLGLAICQRLVTQQGGQISVSSKLGQGTAFTVQLRAAVER
ncbi:MAG: GAF domain-containing protein [Anaerolineae bacterium]|nr:GAF domain-containing protein [Anaerolineae bacterium]